MNTRDVDIEHLGSIEVPWPPPAHAREPRIRFLPHHPNSIFTLCDPLWVFAPGVKCWLFVPRLFETDLASVPWFARSVMSVTAVGVQAPIAHDMLYRYRGTCIGAHAHDGAPQMLQLTRKQSDAVLRDVAIRNNRKPFRARTAYAAVRIGGRFKGPPTRDTFINYPEWRPLWKPRHL